jgi:KUP system potassium uptake protein
VQLGYLPRMQVLHTSDETEGQIFLPWINRILLVLTIAVVFGFRSSANLVSAYGLAVVGTMLINTLLVVIVARRIWRWSYVKVIPVGLIFLGVDSLLLTAVADKFIYGGWFPLALGVLVFTLMMTWRRGRELVMREVKRAGLALEPFIASISAHPPVRVSGTAVFLTSNPEGVPNALLHNLKHNKVLHERNVILTVDILDEPVAEPGDRRSVESLADGFFLVTLRYGFSEDPNIPLALVGVSQCGFPFDMMDTTFFLSRESIVSGDRPGMVLWRDRLFEFLARNATSATAFFQIPGNRLIELGTQVEI